MLSNAIPSLLAFCEVVSSACEQIFLTNQGLQVRYQGVDWRDKSNWGCNFERNPYGNHYIDGGSLEVMEVMFVKVRLALHCLQCTRWSVCSHSSGFTAQAFSTVMLFSQTGPICAASQSIWSTRGLDRLPACQCCEAKPFFVRFAVATGLSLHVQVKQRLIEQRWAYPTNAQLYDKWIQARQQVLPVHN